MNERTRLDEIVAEEALEPCPGVGSPLGGWMHRIATRSFAEGKRASIYALRNNGLIEAGDTLNGLDQRGRVQPAPAAQPPSAYDKGQNCSSCGQRNSVWPVYPITGGLPTLICGNCGRCA